MHRRRTGAVLAIVLGGVALAGVIRWLAGAEERPAPGLDGSNAGARSVPVPADATAVEALHETQREPPPARAASLPAEPPAIGVAQAATVLVQGAVRGASGQRIQFIQPPWVRFVDATGRRRNVLATPGGTYSAQGFEPGTYWIRASAPGFRSVEERLVIAAEPPVVEKDFDLAPAPVLKIRAVTPAGEPLVQALQSAGLPRAALGIIPVATVEPPGQRFTELRGSRNNLFGVGTFAERWPQQKELGADCLGLLVLERDPPVHVSLVLYEAVLATQRVEAGVEEVLFEIEPGRLPGVLAGLRMQLVDAVTRTPLAGAHALFVGGYSTKFGIVSDAGGELVIADQPPGAFDLQIMKQGYAGFWRSVELDRGTTTDLGVIALEPELTLEGTVVDALGRPVKVELDLGVLEEGTGALLIAHGIRPRSRVDGSFQIYGLGRNTYVLRTANHDAGRDEEWAEVDEEVAWVSGHLVADTGSGSIEGFEIRLSPATKVTLRMEGSPADGLCFEVLDGRGWPLVAGRFHGAVPRPLRLCPGNYRVIVRDAGGTLLAERNLVVGTQPVELAIAR